MNAKENTYEQFQKDIKEYLKTNKKLIFDYYQKTVPKKVLEFIWKKAIKEETNYKEVITHFEYLLGFYYDVKEIHDKVKALEKWKKNEDRPY